MPRRVQLQDYKVQYLSEKNQTLVMVTGDRIYYKILDKTFPGCCNSIFDDVRRIYDWGTYVNTSLEDADRIDKLLNMFTYAICIVDNLEQSFALDYYYRPYWDDPEGGQTLAGELIHKVKYKKQRSKAFDKLVQYASRFFQLHPVYQKSDYLLSVPYFGKKEFDLPEQIVKNLCSHFAISDGQHLIEKVKATKPMKEMESREEKEENIRNAFRLATTENITGKSITIIDDVYRSGTTMHTVATLLQNAGAIVQGLVIAKTIRG